LFEFVEGAREAFQSLVTLLQFKRNR